MKDFMDQLVTFKVNALMAGGLTIGSALLGFGGKIAIDSARTEQIQIDIKATQSDIRQIRGDLRALEISIIRAEEQSKLQTSLLKQLIERH